MNACQTETWIDENAARRGGVQNYDPGGENGCETSRMIAPGPAALSETTRTFDALAVGLNGHSLCVPLSLCHHRPSADVVESGLCL